MERRGRPKQTEDVKISKYEQTIFEFTNPEYRDKGYKSVGALMIKNQLVVLIK